MIEDIRPFLCTKEENRKKIKIGINRMPKKEANKRLNHSELVSIASCVRGTFCGSNYDMRGNIYLAEELDPEAITKYWISCKETESNEEDIYNYVCWQLLTQVNDFVKSAKEWKKGMEIYKYRGKFAPDDFEKRYRKIMENRIQEPLKLIRSNPQ